MKNNKLITTIAIACALGLSASAQTCYMDGPNEVCAKAGTVVDEWEEPCTLKTPEGPENAEGLADLITQDPAYKATVQPLAPPSSWGVEGIFDTITITGVGLTLEEPDPDDCSQTVTTPDYDVALYSCDGETMDLLSDVCW